MPKSLQRLLYRSDCAFAGMPHTVDRKVQEIVEAATTANAKANITGALMLSSGVFIQALEGPSAAVEATFERICCDLRHRNVRLLELAAAEERVFADWAMVRVTPTLQLARLYPQLGESHSWLDAATASTAIQMMRTLLLTRASRDTADAKAGAAG